MHYYKFNIAEWSLSTGHLSLEEEAVYFRLVNHYYDTETAIPMETQSVIRRLRLASYSEIVELILNEFFTKTAKGFIHNKCENLLKEYKKTAKKNKTNGAKGGRPKKTKALSDSQKEPNGFPNGSQVEPKHNPNQEPLTNNQEPIKKTLDQSDIDHCFSQFWESGIRKVNKKKSLPLFVNHLVENADINGPTIFDLTTALVNDVKSRIKVNQLGFSEMHPTTYFNGERWNDEIKEKQNETNQQSNTGHKSKSETFWNHTKARINASA